MNNIPQSDIAETGICSPLARADALPTNVPATRLRSSIAEFLREQPAILVSSTEQVASWFTTFCEQNRLPRPFLVLANPDGKGPPDYAFSFEVGAATVDDWFAGIEERLSEPSQSLMDALDRFDPERTAGILAPPLRHIGPRLLGRRHLGWRRPSWAAYEDKTFTDTFWSRAEIQTMRSVVEVPTSPTALERAFSECDDGLGVVISIDASQKINSGSDGVFYAPDVESLKSISAQIASRCERVRVAAFVEGLSCSIHGIVFDSDVAVFRPIEQVILRHGPRMPLLGGNALWTPTDQQSSAARSLAKRVGERLRVEASYRGAFGLDMILSVDGWLPIEINARLGGFIANGGPLSRFGVPVELVHMLAVEGTEAAIDARELETLMLQAFDLCDRTELALTLEIVGPVTKRSGRFQWVDEQFGPTTAPNEEDVIVEWRARLGGDSVLTLSFPRCPQYVNAALGPFVVALLKTVSKMWALSIPEVFTPRAAA